MRTVTMITAAALLTLVALEKADAQACTAPTPRCAETLPPPPPVKETPRQRPATGRADRPIEYDWEKERQREQFLVIHARTVACMREGAVAMLRMGQRNRRDLQQWLAGTCSAALRPWLIHRERFSEHEADTVLLFLADKAIDMALRGPDAIIVR